MMSSVLPIGKGRDDFCTAVLWQVTGYVAIAFVMIAKGGSPFMARILNALASLVIFSMWVSPAMAKPKEPSMSCSAAFGDIWSEQKPKARPREIDGTLIKTPADFITMTEPREFGVIIINKGDFSGWDFTDIPLAEVCFVESKLAGANLAAANGPGSGFINSDLTGADMRGANMPGVIFRNAGLKNVMAQKANFSDGHFDGGWFEGSVAGWNIDGADMRSFKFDCGITLPDGCPVYSGGDPISARETDFTGATLHSFGLFNVSLEGAVIDRTIVGPRQLPYLATANISGNIILRGGDKDIAISVGEAEVLLSENNKRKRAEANPSFDCAKANGKIETIICGEYESALRAFDRDVAKLYKSAKRERKRVKSSQRQWLKMRNKCIKAEYARDCVTESYKNRKSQLLAILGETDWLIRGEEALFVDQVLALPQEFSKTALFKKITPALVGGSSSEILVHREKDGLYSINGSSVGANAHTCWLGATHLYFDKESGWYSVGSEAASIPVFQIRGDIIEVFGSGNPDYDKYPAAADFMSCGARARFSSMRRIEVDETTLAKIRKAFEEAM